MERLQCIARAEFTQITHCNGLVEVRLLVDGTSVPLCEVHTTLYELKKTENSTPAPKNPQSSQ